MLARICVGMAVALTACQKLPVAPRDAGRVSSYGSIKYVVPPAYTYSSSVPINVWVNYPTFRPSKVNNCKDLMVVPPCSDFIFAVWRGTGAVSPKEYARRIHQVPGEWLKSVDEYGYNTSWIRNNPDNMFFEKGDDGINGYFFNCIMGTNYAKKRDGVCLDRFRLSDGNIASFHFSYMLRNRIPAIETDIDQLMKRFRRS